MKNELSIYIMFVVISSFGEKLTLNCAIFSSIHIYLREISSQTFSISSRHKNEKG